MRWLLVLLALAACGRPDPLPAGSLAPCGERSVPPQPPKSGTRNLQNIVAWANRVQLAREATDQALVQCAGKHTALTIWVRQHGGHRGSH